MGDSNDSDSDIDPSDLPDVKVCQERCEQFAALTGTDTACAQFFLQDRKWDLNLSVNAYFDSQKPKDEDKKNNVIISLEAFASAMASATGDPAPAAPINKFKFISWNIDGLNDISLKKRVKAVCNIIRCELPDVVHVQEMVTEAYMDFERLLPGYKCIPGNDPDNDYFTTTLIRLANVAYERHEIVNFPESRMGRNLLIVKGKIADKPVVFLNTHLESTADHAAERKNQLKTAFQKALAVDSKATVLLAGDLNMRDKELEQLGGLPASLEDLWITCGKRPECQYTWDAKRNTNISMDTRFRPQCRFDRIYLRRADNSPITPTYFGLIGLEKIPSCGRFPSDHWGLVTHFDV